MHDQKISDALLLAVDLRPYYARAISALTPVAEPRCQTIGVDGSWRLYYNPEWVAKTSLQDLAATICAHECEHLLRDHAGRRTSTRDPRLWNMAGDLEINDDATDVKLPKEALMPRDFKQPDGEMAEWYYHQLYDQAEKADCACGSGAGGEKPDYELDPEEAPGVTEAGAETIREQVAEAAKAQEASQPGSVPAGVVIWANTRGRAPYVPYQALLAARLQGLRRTASGRGDYSWARLSRRPAPVLRPSGICHPPTVSVIVDTSGSMGSYGETVIGVCQEIVRRSGASVVQCDVNASKHKRKQGFIGGGGTDLRHGFDLAQRDKPDLIVVITDAETPWPAEAPKARTVAVVPHGEPIHGVPAWVDVIRACPERVAGKKR